jgi:Secretion system C-terminal sorting domain
MEGGVEQVGIVCYDGGPLLNSGLDSNAASILNYNLDNFLENVNSMNYGLPWNEKIDVLSMDQEFWICQGQNSSTDAIFGLTYPPTQSTDYTFSVDEFHAVHMPMLKSMYNASRECSANNLRVEDYLETPLDPWGYVSDTALYQLKVGAMELDSIGLYTDRILLSSYTRYNQVLWNEGDYIQMDSEIGRNPYAAYYKKEIWPVFSAENSSDDASGCIECAYGNGNNFSGTDLCLNNEVHKAEWIEQQYFDSLSTSENKQIWTNNLNSHNWYYQCPMRADTDFQVLGDMWFDYNAMNAETIKFDTLTNGIARGFLQFYVTLGHDTQWVPPSTPPITITATTHGGQAPYHYTWYNVDNGNILLFSTTSNKYTVGYNSGTGAYNVSKLGVVVGDNRNDTNVTDYVCIYKTCQNGHGVRRPERHIQNSVTQSNPMNYGNSVKIFPNPNQGQFTVQITSDDANAKNLQVYNMLGEEVYRGTLLNGQGDNTITLNKSSGIYFYRVLKQDGNMIGEGKILIKK